MKKIFKYGMSLMVLFTSLSMSSCSNSSNELPEGPNGKDEPQEFVMTLGFNGEVSVNESPLGRAAGNDLYAVQVYSKKKGTEDKDYAPFAYGLFDDIETLQLVVTEGYTYKFVATMVKDAKNKIKVTESKYGAPFNDLAITSDFVKSSTAGFSELGSGSAWLVDGTEVVAMPTLDRFYGEAVKTPTAEDKDVNIYMLRMVFGLKFKAVGLDSDETIKIAIAGAPAELTISGTETSTAEIIYTFKDIAAAYAVEGVHTEDIDLTITMQNVDVISKSITVTRNMLSTITIHEPNHNGQISITCEDVPMAAGKDYEIDENGELKEIEKQ